MNLVNKQTNSIVFSVYSLILKEKLWHRMNINFLNHLYQSMYLDPEFLKLFYVSTQISLQAFSV